MIYQNLKRENEKEKDENDFKEILKSKKNETQKFKFKKIWFT